MGSTTQYVFAQINIIMKKKYLLPTLGIICLIAVAGMILALTMGNRGAQNTFSPPPFDENAQQGEPNPSDDMGYSQLDARAFKVSLCGKITVEDGKVQLYLTNPDSNSVWLKARIIDENDNCLGETGLIKPGEYVPTIELDKIPDNNANVKIKIMSYEPETYFSMGSATMNTTITVK